MNLAWMAYDTYSPECYDGICLACRCENCCGCPCHLTDDPIAYDADDLSEAGDYDEDYRELG